MSKITKDTKISELLVNPKAQKVLGKYHLPCLSCPMARFEMERLKIGEVCEIYNIDLKSLLKELNELK